ncbi:hypothetical protein [Marinobacter sp. CA1]|uniref:hypothetical protein n=1 Tax=Marinobacter sp. CA1 TaxID=2817656 RepID=UPI001D05D202|nr:hypothetical protein [Marinobacter sp. CA1]UDL05095.1 hypothetical protein J2887_20980 [Marinobacter sp. CA1]
MIRRKRPLRMGVCLLVLAVASLLVGLLGGFEAGGRSYENYGFLYVLGIGVFLFVGSALVGYGISNKSPMGKLGRSVYLVYLRSKRR